ncbi:MAG: HEAT repeat domain-containing protein [Oligoflexus sp.]|nr:HEAT repeat domain-containing protein [Oligoflexus sp.]
MRLSKKQELIPHLAFVDRPDALSEVYLKELANSAAEPMIRETAELGLGILAHQLREQEPERARKILILLNDKLLSATDAKSKIQALSAMGNIGLLEQLDSTLPFTRDADPKIRAAALQSLRYVPAAEVSNLLAAAVEHDPETRVREEASEALTYVPPTDGDLTRYETILISETNISVLKNVLRALANSGSPAAKTLMQKFLDNCGRTEVCGYADSLIRGL